MFTLTWTHSDSIGPQFHVADFWQNRMLILANDDHKYHTDPDWLICHRGTPRGAPCTHALTTPFLLLSSSKFAFRMVNLIMKVFGPKYDKIFIHSMNHRLIGMHQLSVKCKFIADFFRTSNPKFIKNLNQMTNPNWCTWPTGSKCHLEMLWHIPIK